MTANYLALMTAYNLTLMTAYDLTLMTSNYLALMTAYYLALIRLKSNVNSDSIIVSNLFYMFASICFEI